MIRIFTLLFLLIISWAQAQLARDSIRSQTFSIEVTADGALKNWKFLDSLQSIMYNQNLWIGGMNQGVLHQSAQTYRQAKVEFYPGPVSSDSSFYSRYNRVWKVSRNQIDSLKLGLYDTIPEDILDWPAHGDTTYGEPFYLAPYVDANKDGYYDPQLGDFPSIRGDEAVFFIFNDANRPLQNPNSLKLEVHGMLFRLDGGGILDSMFFVDYRLINRSDSTYLDTWLSSWCDIDVGNPVDDIVGSDIGSNAVFAYNSGPYDSQYKHELASAAMYLRRGPAAEYLNGIDDDRDGCIDGVRDAMGNCQPEDTALGIREHMVMTAANFYNNGGGPLGPFYSDPRNELEERNYMRGDCRNGDYLTAHPNYSVWNSSIPSSTCSTTPSGVPFAFPGSSYDSTGTVSPASPMDWYESPMDNADKRLLVSTGPFTFEAGSVISLRLGFLWHRADSTTSHQDGGYQELINKLRGGSTVADSADTSGSGSGVMAISRAEPAADFQVFYDPATAEWYLNHQGPPREMYILSAMGQLLEKIYVEPGERRALPLHRWSRGVYFLYDPQTGQVRKLLH